MSNTKSSRQRAQGARATKTDDVPPAKSTVPISHTNTKSWVAPHVREQREAKKLSDRRFHFCPKSYAWPPNKQAKDIRMEYLEEVEKVKAKQEAREQADEEFRKTQTWFKEEDLPEEPKVEVKKVAFNGKTYCSNHSTVLAQQTVFAPSFDMTREQPLADWPAYEEQKYEGDERIATDPLHGRFLGLPRNPGNDTVNWMQRVTIDQYPLDDFYYGYSSEWDEQFPRGNAVLNFPDYRIPTGMDIWCRNHTIGELEVSDKEGVKMLGEELLSMLDD